METRVLALMLGNCLIILLGEIKVSALLHQKEFNLLDLQRLILKLHTCIQCISNDFSRFYPMIHKIFYVS